MQPVYVYPRDWVYNPPSLRLVCVSRIRRSMSSSSCMGHKIERYLIETLTTDDLDDLRNPNVPISLEDMCRMERKLVLESCLHRGSCRLLEMYILLTDDVVEFNMIYEDWLLDKKFEQFSPKGSKEVQLAYYEEEDLLITLLMARCPNLKSLRWVPLITSPTALENLCLSMPHITKLSITDALYDDKCEGLLKAIAYNLHHLKYLDISDSEVEPKAIRQLLPTDDNALGGCPELVHLDLCSLQNVDVELLKRILLALPKLRFLKHELLVNALGTLTEEEMCVDTARYLSILYARFDFKDSKNISIPIRFDLLAKSPAFQRLKNNVTTVDMGYEPVDKEGQQEYALLADVLMCLPKLNKLTLTISKGHDLVTSLLESIGDRLEYFDFNCLSRYLSIQDIMMTCSNIVHLIVMPTHNANGSSRHQDQVEEPSKLPVLNCLTEIVLHRINKEMCTADMLIALLQSPRLNKITLFDVEAMSDDVMWNVLSSPGCPALSKVTELSVTWCSWITEEPFVHWLTKDTCSLEDLRFTRCEKIDYQVLKDAAGTYPRAVMIINYRDWV